MRIMGGVLGIGSMAIAVLGIINIGAIEEQTGLSGVLVLWASLTWFILGSLVLVGELRIEVTLTYFGFLKNKLSFGSYYIYLALAWLAVQTWWSILIGVLYAILGFYYIVRGCRECGEGNNYKATTRSSDMEMDKTDFTPDTAV